MDPFLLFVSINDNNGAGDENSGSDDTGDGDDDNSVD